MVVLLGQGNILLVKGNPDEALTLLQPGIELSKEINDREGEFLFHLTLSYVYSNKNDPDTALRHLNTAESMVS